MTFLRRVIGRCGAEERQMRQGFQEAKSAAERKRRDPSSNRGRSGRHQYGGEPVRDCLLGVAGAGKSHALKLVRRFFEECLHWEDGIHVQYLATQNTMAALIHGLTIHFWAGIPVNAKDAFNKSQTKGADADVDELFLR